MIPLIMKNRRKIKAAMAVLVLGLCLTGAEFDMYEEADKIWEWQKPAVHPRPWHQGMKLETLSLVLDSGFLQWYEPRPEPGEWEAVAGGKVHAPPEVIWKALTDYENKCELMRGTYLSCQTVSRKDNRVQNKYKVQTTMLQFSTQFEIIDEVIEEAPHRHFTRTVEGGLKGRELEFHLTPVDDGQATLLFIRYYASMKSMGFAIRQTLRLLPMAEWPAAMATANYNLRTYKNEAERIVGHTPPSRPAPLDYHALDEQTLRTIAELKGGLIRETPEGKAINSLALDIINAPPRVVWETLTDFDNYNEIFKNQQTRVIRKRDNQVWAYQQTTSQSVLVFTFSYDMYVVYTLDPPYHVSYYADKGTYEGSTGDYYILPIDDGKRSVLFCAIGMNFERDRGLTSRIIQSGEYPFNAVMDFVAARTMINNLKPAAEARAEQSQ